MPTTATFFLIVYLLGSPGWGPWGFSTRQDCREAAQAIRGLMEHGRVTCEDRSHNITDRWDQ